MKTNKKGISTIVATVLIVLITVAAVTILWAAISPLIDRNLVSGTTCFKATQALSLDADQRYTCYDADTTDNTGVHFRVARKPNTDFLKGFQVSIESAGSTIDTITRDGTTELPTENGMKKYDDDDTATNPLDDSQTYSDVKISIAPRVLIDGAITSCDQSTPVALPACAPTP